MQDQTQQKNELRSRLRKSRDLLDDSIRRRAMAGIEEWTLRELERLRREKDRLIVFSYLSYRSETSTAFLFEEGWRRGDLMLAPKVQANPQRMELRKVEGMSDIEPGVWGIPEPNEECGIYPPEQWPDIDFIVVPGLGYDRQGGRIGYGGGYYDRFAAMLSAQSAAAGKRPLLAGFVLPGQLQDEIPMEPLDLRLDLLITAEGVVHIE